MAVRRRILKRTALRKNEVSSETGQSVLEFLLTLPIFLVLTFMLIKINTVIQVSIVNQRYARAQALFLATNSAYFPRTGMVGNTLIPMKTNQLIIGAAANEMVTGKTNVPEPEIVNITRKGLNGNDDKATPSQRSRVRVRTTVAMCTQQNVLADGSAIVPNNGLLATGPSKLSDSSVFSICRSQYQ